jgi:surfactin family lipopeptide synthetase A
MSTLGSEELDEQLRYWGERLAGVPVLDLPTDRLRPAVRAGRGGVQRFEIGADPADRLKALGKEDDAALFITLLAAYAALLGRFADRRDFAIGTLAPRRGPELDGPAGSLVNTLVVRCDLEGEPSFRELLGRVRDEALEASRNQDVPFEHVVEHLRLDADESRTPVFQAVFQLNQTDEDIAPEDRDGEALDSRGGARTDLTLVLDERRDRSLAGLLEYDADLFDAVTARRLASHLGRLLEAIVADPDLPLGALEILPGPERERILSGFNQTVTPYPDLCLNEWIERQADKTPEAVAIRAGEVTLSYDELDRRANRIAHHLRREGAGPEVPVGACVGHGVNLLPALLGILKAGSHYVPLDAFAPAERTRLILEDAGVELILAEEEPAEALLDTEANVIDVTAALAEGPDQRPEQLADPENLVYVIYTSGSTGRPKGVMISHRALNNYLLWAVDGYGLDGERGAPMVGSISFDLSIPNLFMPLFGGKDVTFLPEDRLLDALADILLEEGADFSLLKLTPSHLDLLRAVLPPQSRLSSVRTYVVGADEVKADTVAAWRRLAPGARIIDEYGPTETVVGCSIYEVAPNDSLDRPVPIGKPIANIDMFVLDERLQPVPVGVRGELYVGGAGVARGYNQRPRVTADRFIPHPYAAAPGSRLYRTGDLARYRENGELEFLGRIDNQVKIRSYRVEPGEVEACLLTHPEVRETAVVAVTGRGLTRLRACVVGEDAGAPPSVSSLRSYLRSILPSYMVPEEFAFLEALPLDAARKLDRASLVAMKI